MNFSARTTVNLVASTFQAGAIFLPDQPAHDPVTREAALPPSVEAQQSIPSSTSFKPSSQIGGTLSRQILIAVEEDWDNAAKRRLKFLATKEALDEISPDEQSELESLTLLRRRKESAVDPVQALREYKQRRLAKQLMCILEKYVEFHRPAENVSRPKRG
jgi:hypothetical protein